MRAFSAKLNFDKSQLANAIDARLAIAMYETMGLSNRERPAYM